MPPKQVSNEPEYIYFLANDELRNGTSLSVAKNDPHTLVFCLLQWTIESRKVRCYKLTGGYKNETGKTSILLTLFIE
jgi:hypothetical protein